MSTKKCVSNQTVHQTREDSNNEMTPSDSFLNCMNTYSVIEEKLFVIWNHAKIKHVCKSKIQPHVSAYWKMRNKKR